MEENENKNPIHPAGQWKVSTDVSNEFILSGCAYGILLMEDRQKFVGP